MLNKGEELKIKVTDNNHVWLNDRQFISLGRVGELLKEREESVRKECRTTETHLEKFLALGYEPSALMLMIDFWKEHHPETVAKEPKKIKLEFLCIGGPYGDATSSYKVDFPIGITVGDFIFYILSDYSVNSGDTWGDFCYLPAGVEKEGASWGSYIKLGSYSHGEWNFNEATMEEYNKIRDTAIKGIHAHGGWSNMDYTLYI